MLAKHGSPVELNVLPGWPTDFEDRDGKFVTEFRTTFNSSFWEFYLHAQGSLLLRRARHSMT